MSAVGLLAGFGADALLGDPQRGHPVAGFGAVAARVERGLVGGPAGEGVWLHPRRPGSGRHTSCPAGARWRGAGAVAALVGGAASGAELAARAAERRRPGAGRVAVLAALTWVALGARSLGTVAARIAARLDAGDLDGARDALPALVGRDAADLDADAVARAVVESVAENTSDAVVGALFWGAVAGPAGVAGFRAANTLDAMWGHRSPRYEQYGWAAARLDDVLGWLPARVTVGLAAACAPLVGGAPAAALRAARADGPAHPSPNSGPVEAAFAGALGVVLGGPLAYDGRREDRPALGAREPGARPVAAADIARVVTLSRAVGVAATTACALARTAVARRHRRPAR